VKVKGLFFTDNTFFPYARFDSVELDLIAALCSPSFEHAKVKPCEGANRLILFGVFDDLCAGVVFLLHVYTLPQDGQKARDFFIFFETFFVDIPPHFLKKIERTFYFLRGEGSNFNLWTFYFN
jgi:hypothetical protein